MMSSRSSFLSRLGWKANAVQSAWELSVLSFNKSIVTLYKLAGFVLLSVILLGMCAYLAMSGFYLMSNRWAVPSILTPNNDKVVQAELAWLGQRHELERFEAELASYKHDLDAARLAAATWKEFGMTYEAALLRETKGSKSKLAAVENIVHAIEGATSAQVQSAPLTHDELDRQLASGLIDIEQHARLKAAATQSALSTAEQKERALALRERVASLKGFIATGAATDVDSLMRRRPLIESKLEAASQSSREAALTARIASLETTVKSYRDTVERMQQNPYVRAAHGDIQIAFVPYSNLTMATKGAPVWDCLLSFVVCRKVGSVLGVVGGEIVGNHPITGRDLRGRFVEMQLKDTEHAEARSLIMSRPPFFF